MDGCLLGLCPLIGDVTLVGWHHDKAAEGTGFDDARADLGVDKIDSYVALRDTSLV